MKILVTGGAGYIGSFMVRRLLDEGAEIVVADSLVRGHKEVIPSGVTFRQVDLLDFKATSELFDENLFDAVIHFAAYISMAESMENPGLYFNNNVHVAVNLLEALVAKQVPSFIFSSTAGVYGNPELIPIPENHAKNPTNPYGESKYTVERMLRWYARVYPMSFTILRYFNAAGAALDGSNGENHEPESHIIPKIMKAVLENREFKLFGTDYNTPDGTAVRDYIHVLDLAEAHLLALKKMQDSKNSFTYNVGTGRGYSNKEVVEAVEKIAGIKVNVAYQARRPGDAAMLVADSKNIQNDLGFVPKYSEIETIVKSAWLWHKNRDR